MCDFGVSAVIMAGISIASAAVGTAASLRQAAFASAMGKNQAKAQDIAAGQARDEGQQEAFNIAQKSAQDAAEVTAEGGASGVDTQQSSLGGVTDRMASASLLGQKSVQVSAMRRAWGFEYAADQSRAQAQEAQMTGALGATESVLGGIGGVMSAVGTYNYRKSKLDTNFKPKTNYFANSNSI